MFMIRQIVIFIQVPVLIHNVAGSFRNVQKQPSFQSFDTHQKLQKCVCWDTFRGFFRPANPMFGNIVHGVKVQILRNKFFQTFYSNFAGQKFVMVCWQNVSVKET